jgi:hypothetical protein
MTLRCERCDMERRDTLNVNTGDIVQRRYVQPEGYHIQRNGPDDELPRIVDFRLAWIERHVDEVRERLRAETRRKRGTS